MIYTEKEKKAIEILKERVKDQIFWTDLGILNLGTLCSILEKQQKEIKRLESKNKRVLYFSNNYCCDDYIPKKEIKEKIHELETAKISIEVGYEKIFETKMDNARIIETLKEILGE